MTYKSNNCKCNSKITLLILIVAQISVFVNTFMLTLGESSIKRDYLRGAETLAGRP